MKLYGGSEWYMDGYSYTAGGYELGTECLRNAYMQVSITYEYIGD